MRNLLKSLIVILFAGTLVAGVVSAAPSLIYQRTILPEVDSFYELGTSTKAWLRLTTDEICLTGDNCQTTWTSAIWGAITGNLSNQTDLQAELDAKINNSTTTVDSITTLSNLTTVNTLTGGATGAGFTVDLDSSTLTCTNCIDISGNTNLAVTVPIVLTDDTLSITQSGLATDGYLDTIDWNTFNNKISSTSLSAVFPLTYVSATGVIDINGDYNIPLTASTTNWNTFYDTPSNRITDGNDLSWATNTLNVDDVFIRDLDFTSNGIMVRTSADNYTNRTLATTTDKVVILNPDGVSGNPTFDIRAGSIENADLVNSTISGVALGGTLNALTAGDTSLTFSGSYDGSTARTAILNMAHENSFTAHQDFNKATTTQLTVQDIFISNDQISDFAGTGLSVTAGVLNAHVAVTISGQDYAVLTAQDIAFGAIEPDDLASSNFGDFTCNGTNCSLNADSVADNEIDYSSVTFDVANTVTAPNFVADTTATSTNAGDLNIAGDLEVGSTFYINSSGIVTNGTWNGTAIDFSSYTNATADTGIKFTADAIGFDCSEVEGVGIDCATEAITLDEVYFGTPFYTFFNATTTDALTEGSSNLYNQTHSGEVTGATALTIASNIVDEDNLLMDTAPTDLYLLVASSSASGGMDWIASSSPLLNFGEGGGGGGVWGAITGTLSDQTDLQLELDAKIDNSTSTLENVTSLPNQTITGTIATGVWEGTDVGVEHGGTGASSLDDGFVLLGSGTGAITPLDVTTLGDLIVGDGTTDPTVLSLGTGGEILGVINGTIGYISTSTMIIGGNAGTATALETARTIGGVSFDGTANITVASATGGFDVTGAALTWDTATSTGANGIDISDGCFAIDGVCVGGGGAGTPGGSDTQLQYNNGGAFGGATGFVFDDGNNYVGIGSSTPNFLLSVGDYFSVNGTGQASTTDMSASSKIYAAGGSSSNPSYTFSGDTNTGFSNQSNNDTILFQAGGGRMQMGQSDLRDAQASNDNFMIKFSANGAVTPAYSFLGDPNTGMFRDASDADVLGFSTDGTERLTIGATGNVGISSTTPGTLFSVGDTNGINFTTATTTHSTTGGIKLTAGCFELPDGNCLSSGGASGATVALDNLASVQINTSLLSDTADTDSLGTTDAEWLNLYIGDAGKAYFGLGQDASIERSAANELTIVASSGVTVESVKMDGGVITGATLAAASNVIEADTVLTIAGLAPDTATTQATQGNITSLGTLTGLTMGGDITLGANSIGRDADNDIDFETDNQITFRTSASDNMILDSNGNVGIGTTSPQAVLEVLGDFRVGEGANFNSLFVDATNGRTGLGTASPGAELDIEGDSKDIGIFVTTNSATATHEGFLQLQHARGTQGSPTATQSGDNLGSIYFGGYDTAFSAGAGITALAAAEWGTGLDSSDSPTHLTFTTSEDGTTSRTERMRITSDGNVGIGTTSPDTTLEVDGLAKGGVASPADGATITLDWLLGNTQHVTLGGNRTIAFSNHQIGAKILFYVSQDSTGSRTLTWPTNVTWGDTGAPTLDTTAGETDIISFSIASSTETVHARYAN